MVGEDGGGVVVERIDRGPRAESFEGQGAEGEDGEGRKEVGGVAEKRGMAAIESPMAGR